MLPPCRRKVVHFAPLAFRLSLRHKLDTAGIADGARAAGAGSPATTQHPAAAREEAARKLLGNHEAVLADITRALPTPTQPQLRPVSQQERCADARAAARVAPPPSAGVFCPLPL